MKPHALLVALRKFGKAVAKRPAGEGWFTLAELAQQEQATVPAIKYRIEQAKKRGVAIEMQPGTVLDDEGTAKRTQYYRLKP